MKILAVDTATEACSAALLCESKVTERYQLDPRGHSRRLMSMIEALLFEAGVARTDLDGIAYDCGPGSFTGIRIGAGVAQGLALGLNRPLLGLSSLMTLAEEVKGDRVLPAIDARMGEVYWARLARDEESGEGCVWRDEARVSVPAVVPKLMIDEIGVGSGWDGYSDAFGVAENDPQRWLPDRCPRASDISRIACRCFDSGVVSGGQIVPPIYIRDAVT